MMKTTSEHLKLNTKAPFAPRLALALALYCIGLTQAAPVGGVLTSGNATISSTANTTTINQSTSKAIIQWQGFNVGASESVRFNQPSSSAIILNRVMGPDGSSILGNISANGRVFLINPNGILFGSGSQVNVGGMVASTLGITDANFNSGNYRFNGNSSASISNQGNLKTNADGGYIALLGANVSNNGLIHARLGIIALAAGNGLTLDVAGDRLLNVSVDQGAVNALVSNGHLVIADGGQVLLTARGAGNLLSNAVNNTGLIQAQSINNLNGSIVLSAGSDAGVVNVSGSLDASGMSASQTGGSVQLLGNTVNLANAQINVSGNAGGGQALVGGNFNGAGPQANSLYTNINSASVINADAVQAGNGGKIAVWSDIATVMGGTLTARGGAIAGDGGFIETSGKHLTISDSAYINTLAPRGKTGMWLLDPLNWTIALTPPIEGETPSQLETSLASSNRTITATNDINVNDAVTWSTARTLSLEAGHNVNINAPIVASTAGAQINMTAGNDVLITGALTASGAANQINVTAIRDINATGTITSSASADNKILMTAGNQLEIGTVTTTGTAALIAGNNGTGLGTVKINTFLTAPTTIVRFNPDTYASTSTEIATYQTKITSTTSQSIKGWALLKGNDKTYDTSPAATLSFKGTPTVDMILNAGTANFANKNVGTDKAITYSGYSVTATDLVLYSATGSTLGSGTSTANITPAPLVVSATGINKVYDANTSATVNLSTTPLAGDSVASSYTGASFLTKSAATGKAVNVSGIALTGTDAANYTANTTTATTANITPAPLVVSATGINKVYDANTSATVNLSTTPLAGDSVASSYTGASFSNAYIGGNKPVSVVGITITGADAANYQANTSATTTASITPNGTPNPANSVAGPEAIPIIPPEASTQAPIALEEDILNGTSTPVTAPFTEADITPGSFNDISTPVAAPFAEADIASGSFNDISTQAIMPFIGTGITSGSLIALKRSNQSTILIVAKPQKGPELQSLFSDPVIIPFEAPYKAPYVAPYRAPKQGRN